MAWTHTDLFNSDTKSLGDLNGQDGWTADARWDVVTTSPYEGDQCITAIFEGGSTPTLTLGADVSAGIMYVAGKFNSQMISVGDCTFYLRDTASSSRAGVGLHTGELRYTSAASTRTSFGITPTAGSWYLFEIEVNSLGQARFRCHDGSSWTTQTGWCSAFGGSGLDVRSININQGSGGNAASQSWWDTITPTNPISSTSIKTYNGLAVASVKTVNGLAIASVKTKNGLA